LPQIHQIAFGGRAPPGPAAGAKALPRPLAAIRGPTSKGRKRERRGREGEGKERKEAGAPQMTFLQTPLAWIA